MATETMKRAALIAALAALAPAAALAAPPPAPASAAPAAMPKAATPPEVKTSTTAPVQTVGTIYTVDKMRDPFLKMSGGALSFKPMMPEDFNIHNLSLRGLMKDSGSDYALFSDVNFGASFILRKGRLYDGKGKLVPGVSGSLNVRQKTADLMTRENDVQVFRLGEEGRD